MTAKAETFTVTAFRYDQKASVLYQSTEHISVAAHLVHKALEKYAADVVNIRRVMEKRPT